MTTLVIRCRVLDVAPPVDHAWLQYVRAKLEAEGARITSPASEPILAWLPSAQLTPLVATLNTLVYEAEGRALRVVFAVCEANRERSADQAAEEAERLLESAGFSGVLFGQSLSATMMANHGALETLVPVARDTIAPSARDPLMPPASDTVPPHTVDADPRLPLDSNARSFARALLERDWSTAQTMFDAIVGRATDPRIADRLDGLLALAKGEPLAAARALRRGARSLGPVPDPRAALCLALANVCEGDALEGSRLALAALADARESKETAATAAAERMLRLALDAAT